MRQDLIFSNDTGGAGLSADTGGAELAPGLAADTGSAGLAPELSADTGGAGLAPGLSENAGGAENAPQLPKLPSGETLKKLYGAEGPYGMTFVPPHILSGMPEDTPLLLALSGGPDSSALFYRLLRYCESTGAQLSVAHVNHMIRGEEAVRDMNFVRETAERAGVRCYVAEINVPALALQKGQTVEQAAREARYAYFDRLMAEHGIPILVTAHTNEDRVETTLFNLIRGAGLNGLCGIRPTRPTAHGLLVRPLLYTSKAEILRYCEIRRLRFVVDSTNADDEYTRNFVRHRILPEMEQINPSLVAAVSRMADALACDEEFIDSHVGSYFEQYGEAAYEIRSLASLHRALLVRVLDRMYNRALRDLSDDPAGWLGQSIINPRHLETVHLELLCDMVSGKRRAAAVELPGSVEARIVRRRLVFSRRAPRK